jgi:transcriptional regulator GlxA family with amidase domain
MTETLGVLMYEKAQPIDIIGPWEVFSFWKNALHAPLEMLLISENGSYVPCDHGVVLKAHTDFEHCPSLDYLVIPGGRGRTTEVKNEKLISFIQEKGEKCQYILSVCTGAFLLHQSGLVKEESITTYWRALPELRSHSNLAIKEERIVKSGKIWTSGGVSSGIDLALSLIAEIAGKEVAGQVQLLFEYFPDHPSYASLDTVNQLPPYYGNTLPPHVSAYITRYIKSNIKK